MSVRRGLAAFGISAAVTIAGVASGHEALTQGENLGRQQICERQAGDQACKNLVVTEGTMRDTKLAEEIYAGIGGFALILGTVGTVGAYVEVLDKWPQLPRR